MCFQINSLRKCCIVYGNDLCRPTDCIPFFIKQLWPYQNPQLFEPNVREIRSYRKHMQIIDHCCTCRYVASCNAICKEAKASCFDHTGKGQYCKSFLWKSSLTAICESYRVRKSTILCVKGNRESILYFTQEMINIGMIKKKGKGNDEVRTGDDTQHDKAFKWYM